MAVLAQSFERQTAVILSNTEYEFEEGNNADFLLQILKFFHNNGESADEFLVSLDCIVETLDISSSESLEQIIKPVEIGSNQTLQDFFVQQFCDIENVFAQEDSHSHLSSPASFFLRCQVICWGISQEHHCTVIEVFLVFLSSVVLRENIGHETKDPRANILNCAQVSLYFVKNLKTVVMLTQIKSLFCLSDTAIEACIAFPSKSLTCILEEDDSLLQVLVLRTAAHSNLGILEGV